MRTTKMLTILVLVLAIANNAAADTPVSGIIDSNTTWTWANSPYIVTGDVVIKDGVNLTIEPIVIIKYSGPYEIVVKGAIIANGTSANRITFTSSTPSTSSGATMLKFEGADLSVSQLNHIKMEYASKSIRLGEESEHDQKPKNTGTLTASNIEIIEAEILTDGYNTQAKLVLNNATITKTSIRGEYPRSEPIEITNAAISDSTITSESYNKGITIQNSTVANTSFRLGCCGANFHILSSIVEGSSFEACCGSPVNGPLEIIESQLMNVGFNLPVARATIMNSTFAYNGLFVGTDHLKIGNGTMDYSSLIGNGSNTGLEITGYAGHSSNGTFAVTYSDIMENTIGIKLGGGTGSFSMRNSNIKNNLTYNIENRKLIDVNAVTNYWGTTDVGQITAKIFDYYDDPNFGKVVCSPFLTSHDTSAPISPPTGLAVSTTGTDIIMNWYANPESDAAGYKVYWGTQAEPFFENVIHVGNSLGHTVTGLPADTYYVAVTAYDNDYNPANDDPDTIVNENQTNGNESWYATTIAFVGTPDPRTLTVLAPNGGESLLAGESFTINWQSTGPISDVLIEYSTNSGTNWIPIATVPNTSSYQWLVPSVTSDQCLVAISDASNLAISDTSDDVFTIFVCQAPFAGDINDDCYVNLKDFAIIAGDWLKCGNPLDPNCAL